jgi:coenzyme PQQ precursor peptide PqqA
VTLLRPPPTRGGGSMEWEMPEFEEIALAAEVTMYLGQLED